MDKDNKQWDGLTESGTLPIGVYYAGTRHRDFILRAPLAGDAIKALQDHPEGLGMLVGLDCHRRQLLKLGDIPAEALTLELLQDGLTEIDWKALTEADKRLEKKLMPPSGGTATGE